MPTPFAEIHPLVDKALNDLDLSKRERQVAELIVQGYDAAKIMDRLVIRPGTFSTHKRSIFSKLGVRRQAEMVSMIMTKALEGADIDQFSNAESPQ